MPVDLKKPRELRTLNSENLKPHSTFLIQSSMFDFRRSKFKVLFLLAASLFGQTQTDLDTQRLYRISQQEQKIYHRLGTDPDFYTDEDLEHELGEVLRSYSNYLSENPKDVSALILYGKLLRRIGENDQAFKVFLKADELDPAIAVVKQQIGNHLVETDNGKAALMFYLNAVELQPEVPEYNYALGEILHIFRDEFLSDQLFTRDAIDREMLKAFRTAAQLNPDDFDMQMRLGEAYYDLESPDWKIALLHWKKLRKATPDYNELRCQILDLHQARILVTLGRKQEASELLNGVTQPGLQITRQQILEEIAQHSQKSP